MTPVGGAGRPRQAGRKMLSRTEVYVRARCRRWNHRRECALRCACGCAIVRTAGGPVRVACAKRCDGVRAGEWSPTSDWTELLDDAGAAGLRHTRSKRRGDNGVRRALRCVGAVWLRVYFRSGYGWCDDVEFTSGAGRRGRRRATGGVLARVLTGCTRYGGLQGAANGRESGCGGSGSAVLTVSRGGRVVDAVACIRARHRGS